MLSKSQKVQLMKKHTKLNHAMYWARYIHSLCILCIVLSPGESSLGRTLYKYQAKSEEIADFLVSPVGKKNPKQLLFLQAIWYFTLLLKANKL